MSGSRDDPFGSGGKTVIRPNPGGMPRPNPQGGTASPAPAWSPPPAPGSDTAGGYNSRVNAPAYAPGAPTGPGIRAPAADDWLRGPDPARGMFPSAQQAAEPVPDLPKIPLDVALRARDAGVIASSNPITAAATPLLILLGRLRLMIVDLQAVPLMTHVASEIMRFEKTLLEGGIDPNDAAVAKYALCGTADDIVQNLPGTDTHVWLQYSMLAQFFQVRTSGVGFYEELNRILQNPAPKLDLLELMHACLSLGFEGQYRGSQRGASELSRIRRQVYETLRNLRSPSDQDISPRWRGLELRMRQFGARIPVWALGSAVAALMVGVFFLLRFMLGADADVLADKLVALHPAGGVTLQRADYAPASTAGLETTQLQRIRAALAEQIEAGGVTVEAVADSIVIGVNNVLLFESGSATVRPAFETLAGEIADALQNEPGPINITGFTDNVQPSGTGRFKSNYDLSVARAKGVAAIIETLIEDPTRLTVEGKGELEPIGDNGTAEGRAMNRRVEIAIPREETLRS